MASLEYHRKAAEQADPVAPAPTRAVDHLRTFSPERVSVPAAASRSTKSGYRAVLEGAGYPRSEADTPEGPAHQEHPGTPATAADQFAVALAPSIALAPPAPELAIKVEELYRSVKRIIAEETCLPDHFGALLTFWVISTWLQTALPVCPCVILVGPAHEAMMILQTLDKLCKDSFLLGSFKKSSVRAVRWAAQPTLLLFQPKLDKEMVAFIASSTTRGFWQLIGDCALKICGPKAIYLGEKEPIPSIPYSIHVNVSRLATAEVPTGLRAIRNAEQVQTQLRHYAMIALEPARRSQFSAAGHSSETLAMINSLARCLVDAPQLQAELIDLLTPRVRQEVAERFETFEGLVATAAFTLSHLEHDHIFVKEIATEVNRMLQIRGERSRVSPEKVGHAMKRLGLQTRRLGQAGNGLTLDRTTRTRIHQVAAAYQMEDCNSTNSNLHCLFPAQTKEVI